MRTASKQESVPLESGKCVSFKSKIFQSTDKHRKLRITQLKPRLGTKPREWMRFEQVS